jgi:hypothetical protein
MTTLRVREPKQNDPVMVRGRHDRFVVLRVNPKSKTADLRSVSAQSEYTVHHVPWAVISYLAENQDAARMSEREASLGSRH